MLDVAAVLNTATHPPMDVMLINQILHLSDCTTQITAAKNLVALSKPGTWILGYQIGSRIGRAVPNIVQKDEGDEGTADGENMAFFHSEQTWRHMWKIVERVSGTKWRVESRLRELLNWGLEPEDSRWMGPNAVRLEFFCCRVDKKAEKL